MIFARWCRIPTPFCIFGVANLRHVVILAYYSYTIIFYLFGHGVGFLHHFGFLV